MSHKKPKSHKRYTAQVGERGRLVLPAELRERLSLNAGDRVVLSLEDDGSLRLVTAGDQVKKLKGMYAHLAPERSLSEELIRERRQEARRERKR
jgi:AbrB family looped-hinge helix DNA binding protein